MDSQDDNRERTAGEIRRDLSGTHALALGHYQQHHRDLLEALRDTSVSQDVFDRMCDELTAEAKALKRTQIELKRQRDAMG